MPSWAPTRLGELKGKHCVCYALCNSASSIPGCCDDPRARTPPQQAGMHQLYPVLLQTQAPQFKRQNKAPGGFRPGLVSEPLPFHYHHMGFACADPAGVNPTVVTDYGNHNSPGTQYFFIHMVCALRNQINNRLASISSFYRWQEPTATEIDLKPLITQFLRLFMSPICNNPTLWKLEFNILYTLQDHQL